MSVGTDSIKRAAAKAAGPEQQKETAEQSRESQETEKAGRKRTSAKSSGQVKTDTAKKKAASAKTKAESAAATKSRAKKSDEPAMQQLTFENRMGEVIANPANESVQLTQEMPVYLL